MSTQTLEEFRAQMRRELSAAANQDLKAEVQRVQKAHGCSFEEAWRRVERETPGLFRIGATVGSSSEHESPQSYLGVEARAQRLIYQSGGTMTMSEALRRARGDAISGSNNPGKPMDPRVARENAAHKKISDRKASEAIDDHVGRMKKIRELMVAKNWSFDQAFAEICKQETAAKTAPASATALTTPVTEPVGRVEADNDYPVHPGQAAALAKGLLLVEGGFALPILPVKISARES